MYDLYHHFLVIHLVPHPAADCSNFTTTLQLLLLAKVTRDHLVAKIQGLSLRIHFTSPPYGIYVVFFMP